MDHDLPETVLAVINSPDVSQTGPALRRFSLRAWERSAFWLDASGLALHFVDALHRHRLTECIPAPVLRDLEQKACDNRRRTEALRAEFARVNAALGAARVRFAALKGFTLVPDYCPDSSLRLQLDLDYLVRRADMPNVSAAVEALGYQLVSDLPFEVRFATNPQAVRRHADLYKPPLSNTLEFHFSLFDRPELGVEGPDDALVRARPAPLPGRTAPWLAADDLFLHQLFHAFQDVFMFSIRLSSLLEIANGIRARQETSEFWDRMRRRCEAWSPRAGAMAGLVLALVNEVFPCDIPMLLRAWTVDRCPYPVLLWVRDYGRSWALQAFPGNKLSLLVTRELMEPGNWRAYAWKSLLPFRRSLRNGALGTKLAPKREARHMFRRAAFHVREAVRVTVEWPRWIWKRQAGSRR